MDQNPHSQHKPETPPQPRRGYEPEFSGPWWKHPYLIYIWLTTVLFLTLVFIGWMAWENGWVPKR